MVWGKRWRRITTAVKKPDYDKESNLVVLCFKCHKRLDKIAPHGKIRDKKKRRERRPPQPSAGFTGKDVHDIVFGRRS